MKKKEARKIYQGLYREFEKQAELFWECRKARSSGEISEQEYNEKLKLIIQQQDAMKKEIFEAMYEAIFGDHTENHQGV